MMAPVMNLEYSYLNVFRRTDPNLADGWCEKLRDQYRLLDKNSLDNGSLMHGARLVATLPSATERFIERQKETGIVPVVAFHSTPKDENRELILREGFLAKKDTGSEHFGHGIHFTTTLPRFPGQDFDCFGRNHFLSLLLLQEGKISSLDHNLWWSVSSGVVTVNDDACMIPIVSF